MARSKLLTVRVSDAHLEALDLLRAQQGQSQADVITDLLRQAVADRRDLPGAVALLERMRSEKKTARGRHPSPPGIVVQTPADDIRPGRVFTHQERGGRRHVVLEVGPKGVRFSKLRDDSPVGHPLPVKRAETADEASFMRDHLGRWVD